MKQSAYGGVEEEEQEAEESNHDADVNLKANKFDENNNNNMVATIE